MSKATTIEKNNRFYEQPDGKVLTENEQLKEWLIIANKEIERLNNIINELEKYIKESCWKDDWGVESIYVKTLLDKLQELKGSDK